MQNTPSDWPWRNLPDILVPLLTETLARQLTAGPLFMLVDPFSGDLELGANSQGRPHQRIAVPDAGLNQSAEQLPYLVEISDACDPLLTQSVEWAALEHMVACNAGGDGPYRIGGWLQPHEAGTGTALARQIGFLLHASGKPQHGRYLRLADRRVVALLHCAPTLTTAMPAKPALRPIDWQKQLQGIAAWIYLDANFGLQRLSGNPGAPVTGSLQLDAAYWHLMGSAETINRTLMAWQGTRYPLPQDALVQAAQRLMAARQAGLSDSQDCIAYATEALNFPAFAQWARMQEYIVYCQKHRQAFALQLPVLRKQWSTTF